MKEENFPDPHHDASNNAIFGFWIYLMTDFILFATLFATYAVLKNATFGGPSARELFNLPNVLIQTLILSTSSLTCGLAMLSVPMNDKKKLLGWYGVTFLLGVAFLFFVWSDFSHLIQSGNGWTRNAFLSAYFTLIGTHALHIVLGLFFMAIILHQVWHWGLIPATQRRLTCLSMFWFFSYIIWIFMYTIVYLIGVV